MRLKRYKDTCFLTYYSTYFDFNYSFYSHLDLEIAFSLTFYFLHLVAKFRTGVRAVQLVGRASEYPSINLGNFNYFSSKPLSQILSCFCS